MSASGNSAAWREGGKVIAPFSKKVRGLCYEMSQTQSIILLEVMKCDIEASVLLSGDFFVSTITIKLNLDLKKRV
jgi:hypothetical protein